MVSLLLKHQEFIYTVIDVPVARINTTVAKVMPSSQNSIFISWSLLELPDISRKKKTLGVHDVCLGRHVVVIVFVSQISSP